MPSVPKGSDNTWALNLRVNSGAYGGTREASMPPHGWALLADIDNDGIVDLIDFAEFASLYAETGDELFADFSRDGTVSIIDLELLAGDWMNSTTWH